MNTLNTADTAPHWAEVSAALAPLGARPVALVGGLARAVLGERRGRAPAELLVADTAEALRGALPTAVPVAQDALRVGEVLIFAAPEGLDSGLRRRAVRADAVGVLPDGGLLDPLGGRAALAERRLDFELPGDEIATARIPLRVASLASELAVQPPEPLVSALVDLAPLSMRVGAEFARTALTALLVGRDPERALHLLEATRMLAFTLPEVAALVGFHKTARFHHKDVWLHTCQVVRQAVPRPEIRWAALLHDVAKPYTRTYEPPRQVHFLHHDELGALMFDGISARLAFPPALATRVRALVFHHLRANLYQRTWTDAAVRRFGIEMGDLLPDLLALSRADVTSKRPGRRREAMHHLHDLRTRIERLRVEDAARAPAVPKGLGAAIIAELGVTPGPIVGELRRRCESAVRAGELPREPAVEACIAYLRGLAVA